MAEETKCIIKRLHPDRQDRRDARTYREAQVKTILQSYTRDYEQAREIEPWSDQDVKEFIETAFDFD